MCIGCIIISWVETPSTPPFIGLGGGGVGFTWNIRSVMGVPDPGLHVVSCSTAGRRQHHLWQVAFQEQAKSRRQRKA
jgi:hypothetical protein